MGKSSNFTYSWISAETEAKENDFRGLLRMHAKICGGIFRRWPPRKPYLYVDLYAGPGLLPYEGREFDGSPLIAREVFAKAGIPYEAVHFEQDEDVAAQLAEKLWTPKSIVDTTFADPEDAQIIVGRCQDEFPCWLARQGRQRDRYGLVYADPVKDEIPHEVLNCAARVMPKVDLLSYVAATQYKRRRGEDLHRNGHTALPLLSDHIRAVDKKYAVVRTPRAQNQYTFVLWSNWENFPEWTNRGFYSLDSPSGQSILEKLTMTRAERFDKYQMPLPFEENE